MLPLNGVRVLAVEQYGAGPFGTMFLADQGAEVIKVENPADGGDMSRAVGPHFFAPGDSLFFHSFNRNKKSLTLDLGRPEGPAGGRASGVGREVDVSLFDMALTNTGYLPTGSLNKGFAATRLPRSAHPS